MGQWLSYEFGDLWVIEAGDEVPSVQARIEVRFKEVKQEDVQALTDAMGSSSQQMIQKRLAAGKRCIAGWVEDQIAVYGWISFEREEIGEMQRPIRFGANEAYIWNCVTLPAYRRKRLYTALLSFMICSLRDDGTERIWIGTALGNQPSIRAFTSTGFQPVLRAYYVRFIRPYVLLLLANPGAPASLVATAQEIFAVPDELALGPVRIGL